MRNLLIVFFVLVLILLIMIFPIKSRMMAHFNLLKMKGYYSIKILFVKILCGMIYIDAGKVYISNLADAISSSYSSPFMKKFATKLLGKMDIKKIELFFTGGFAENSFSSAIVCGSVSSIVYTAYSYLSQKYDNVKLYNDIKPTFGQDNLELTFDIVVSISFMQVLSAIFGAAIETKKERRLYNER